MKMLAIGFGIVVFTLLNFVVSGKLSMIKNNGEIRPMLATVIFICNMFEAIYLFLLFTT